MALHSVFDIGYIEYEGCQELPMSRAPTTMTVRLNEELGEFVAANVGEYGTYDNVSEYVRDLIRRDKEKRDQAMFERLQAELNQAFAAPEASYHPLSAAEVIARNQD